MEIREMRNYIILSILLFGSLFCKENKQTDATKNPDNKKIQAIVIFSAGDVNANNQRLRTGDIVEQGTLIRVGAKSSVEIQILNSLSKTNIKMNENSELLFEKKNIESSDKENFKIEKGEVLLEVQKSKRNEEVIILTPSMIAGVRGTKFIVSVGSEKSTIEVVEGNVSISPYKQGLNSLPRIVIEKNEILLKTENFMKQSEIVLDSGEKGTLTNAEVDKYLQSAGINNLINSPEISKLVGKENPSDLELESVKKSISKVYSDPAKIEKANRALEKKIVINPEKMSEQEKEKRLKEYDELVRIENTKLQESEEKTKIVKEYSNNNKKIIIKKIENLFGKDSQVLILKTGEKIEGVIDSDQTGDISVYTIDGLKIFKREEVEAIE